jgi:hypothetical protein
MFSTFRKNKYLGLANGIISKSKRHFYNVSTKANKTMGFLHQNLNFSSFVVLYIMRHLRKSLRLSSILRQFKCCNMSPTLDVFRCLLVTNLATMFSTFRPSVYFFFFFLKISILNVIDKITRSNFSNSFKRPQFVKLCTIIKSVTFYIIAFQHTPIRVIGTFEIDFNTENQISVYYIYYEIIYFMKRETSNDYSFNSNMSHS